MFCIDYN